MGTLVRIEAPHFVAGLDAEGGRVVRAAPIVRYMIGWDGRRVARYCASKGWAWTAQPYDEEVTHGDDDHRPAESAD